MAIKKQYLKNKPVCKVTFSVPAEEAKSVVVVGSFNEWNTKKATKLKKLKNRWSSVGAIWLTGLLADWYCQLAWHDV